MLRFFKFKMAAIAAVVLFGVVAAHAAETPSETHLHACLKKAADLPDIAVAEANAWLKQGGGDAAVLCRATAQFHNNEFIKSAGDFTSLADGQKDPKQASLLYQQAALAWQRAQDYKKSEDAYAHALRFEQHDPDLWMARGNERAAAQHYWDAIEDLNKALDIMPDMPEALRTRGQVWSKLGLDHNAEVDFRHAGEVQAEEDVAASNAKKKVVNPPAVSKVSTDATGASLRRGTTASADGVKK